jgi:hypothetical protein
MERNYTWSRTSNGKPGVEDRGGSAIKIEENWIPRSGAQCPLGRRQKVFPKLVNFINAGRDRGMKRSFYDIDVAHILRTPIGPLGTIDFHAWNYTKNWSLLREIGLPSINYQTCNAQISLSQYPRVRVFLLGGDSGREFFYPTPIGSRSSPYSICYPCS